MPVYTIHEPPPRRAGPMPEAERFTFVRDGFSWAAFVFAPLWMLGHRMWLVLAGYIVLSGAIEAALVLLGGSRLAASVAGLFISLLVGLEASTLRRLALSRRGWTNLGIVSGEDLEDAERRFFDEWLHEPAAEDRSPVPSPSAGPGVHSVPRVLQTPNVVGLFPEPGARR